MKSWEEERPIYEEELTPQQKELAREAAKEHLQKEYERGRKTIVIMMSIYVGIRILAALFNVFVIADAEQKMGNNTFWHFACIFHCKSAWKFNEFGYWENGLYKGTRQYHTDLFGRGGSAGSGAGRKENF